MEQTKVPCVKMGIEVHRIKVRSVMHTGEALQKPRARSNLSTVFLDLLP
jgi:hypothetical protein